MLTCSNKNTKFLATIITVLSIVIFSHSFSHAVTLNISKHIYNNIGKTSDILNKKSFDLMSLYPLPIEETDATSNLSDIEPAAGDNDDYSVNIDEITTMDILTAQKQTR